MHILVKKHQFLLVLTGLLIPVCVFLALSFKLPYSGRSLIGNFDPFPDTFYYVVPPLKFVTTGKFETSTQYGKVNQSVPPLYGLSLIPGYFLNHDPRTYYFTNIVFGLLSLGILFLILKKSTNQSILLTSFGTLVYVTIYGIYWQPQLAMAENLLLLILLLALYFWQKPESRKTTVVVAVLAWCLFATKFVAWPLTVGWIILLLVRSWLSRHKRLFFQELALVLVISLSMLLLTTGVSPITTAFHQLSSQIVPSSATTQSPTVIWFSPHYLTKSFPAYGLMLLGKPVLQLWSDHRLVPPLFLLITLAWSILAVWRHWLNQKIAWPILLLGTCQFAFLSMIEMVQSRYAYVFIPLIIIGTTLGLHQLRTSLKTKFTHRTVTLITLLATSLLLLLHLGLAFPELKTQLLVNRHRSEVAWWREGLVLTNQYFKNNPTDKQRVIITALPPFLWEMYASRDLIVLPLNEINYFTTENIWASRPSKGQTWLEYYQSLVEQPDTELYISTSGFTGGDYDHFLPYQITFKLEEVMNECNQTCKVYRVSKQ